MPAGHAPGPKDKRETKLVNHLEHSVLLVIPFPEAEPILHRHHLHDRSSGLNVLEGHVAKPDMSDQPFFLRTGNALPNSMAREN